MRFTLLTVFHTSILMMGNRFGLRYHPCPTRSTPHAQLIEVYSDPRFSEGPTWDPGTGMLYFTAISENKEKQILRWDGPGRVHVFQDKTNGVIGTCRSKDGRLLGVSPLADHRQLRFRDRRQKHPGSRRPLASTQRRLPVTIGGYLLHRPRC